MNTPFVSILTLFFCLSFVSVHAQWDDSSQVQLKLRSGIDIKDSGWQSPTARLVLDRFDRMILVRIGRVVPDSMFSFVLERVLPNGMHDPSFGNEGIAIIPFDSRPHGPLHGVFCDDQGAIVLIVSVGPTAVFTRLREDGAIDRTYGDNGFVRLDSTLTCGKYEGAATGHNVSLACTKVVDDTTKRCVLVRVSERGVVEVEPYISSRCDRVLLYHKGEQFLGTMKSIVKLDRNGLVDTSFGGFGSVRWRRFNGQGILNDLILYDDTTLVVLDEEYSQESPPLESEYAIRYFDTRTGEDRGVAYIPFEYVADPQLWLHRLVVDANGTLYAGGGFLERRDTAKTYPTIYSFVNRTEPNRAFYDTAQYSLPRSYDCFITDMRLNSRGQLILYAWYDNLVRIGEPMTSVPPTIELPSLSVSPNPCVDRVVLRASFPCADLRYELISMLGVVVQSGIIEQDGSLEFSPAVIKGAYGLRLQTRDQLVRSAIIYVTRHD